MPSKKRKDGTFRDIAHPLNSETRRMMEERVLARYREEVGGEAGSLTPRSLANNERDSQGVEPQAQEASEA
jgi:hypothetical protein